MQWEGENSNLTYGWWGSYVCPQVWFIKILLAGETLNIFLLTGISNINIFLIKKKVNVVVYSNIYDKFSSKNLAGKLKNNNNKRTYKLQYVLLNELFRFIDARWRCQVGRNMSVWTRKKWGQSITVPGYSLYWWKYRNLNKIAPKWN